MMMVSAASLRQCVPSQAVEAILRRYRIHGAARRSDRMPVTEAEHAAQCGTVARRSGLAPPLVAACLLHDFGRLLEVPVADHAEAGAEALAAVLGPEVTEPIRLHSRAWRYLAAVEPDYALAHPLGAESLPAEEREPMSGAEVAAYIELPWAAEAAAVQRIDAAGRLPGLDTPPLQHFASLLESLVATLQRRRGESSRIRSRPALP
jgi:predicted HD phosphohydrolase